MYEFLPFSLDLTHISPIFSVFVEYFYFLNFFAFLLDLMQFWVYDYRVRIFLKSVVKFIGQFRYTQPPK